MLLLLLPVENISSQLPRGISISFVLLIMVQAGIQPIQAFLRLLMPFLWLLVGQIFLLELYTMESFFLRIMELAGHLSTPVLIIHISMTLLSVIQIYLPALTMGFLFLLIEEQAGLQSD